MRGGEGTKALQEEKAAAAAAPEGALVGKECGSAAVIPCGSCLGGIGYLTSSLRHPLTVGKVGKDDTASSELQKEAGKPLLPPFPRHGGMHRGLGRAAAVVAEGRKTSSACEKVAVLRRGGEGAAGAGADAGGGTAMGSQ